MDSTITLTPKFDLKEAFHPNTEELAYVWGWDLSGNTYYGLCFIKDDIIGAPLAFITIPYRFTDNEPYTQFRKDLVKQFEEATKKTA